MKTVVRTFMIASRWIILTTINILDKFVEKINLHSFVFSRFFPEKSAL